MVVNDDPMPQLLQMQKPSVREDSLAEILDKQNKNAPSIYLVREDVK